MAQKRIKRVALGVLLFFSLSLFSRQAEREAHAFGMEAFMLMAMTGMFASSSFSAFMPILALSMLSGNGGLFGSSETKSRPKRSRTYSNQNTLPASTLGTSVPVMVGYYPFSTQPYYNPSNSPTTQPPQQQGQQGQQTNSLRRCANGDEIYFKFKPKGQESVLHMEIHRPNKRTIDQEVDVAGMRQGQRNNPGACKPRAFKDFLEIYGIKDPQDFLLALERMGRTTINDKTIPWAAGCSGKCDQKIQEIVKNTEALNQFTTKLGYPPAENCPPSVKPQTPAPGGNPPEFKFYDRGPPEYIFTNLADSPFQVTYQCSGSPQPIKQTYKTSEHFFQAHRFPQGSQCYNEVMASRAGGQGPFKATRDCKNRLGAAANENPDWEGNQDREKLMCLGVLEKVKQNQYVKTLLCKQTNTVLIEDAKDKDAFWGNGIWDPTLRAPRPGTWAYIPGKNNKLGETLMWVRKELCNIPIPTQYTSTDPVTGQAATRPIQPYCETWNMKGRPSGMYGCTPQ